MLQLFDDVSTGNRGNMSKRVTHLGRTNIVLSLGPSTGTMFHTDHGTMGDTCRHVGGDTTCMSCKIVVILEGPRWTTLTQGVLLSNLTSGTGISTTDTGINFYPRNTYISSLLPTPVWPQPARGLGCWPEEHSSPLLRVFRCNPLRYPSTCVSDLPT